MGMLSLKRLMSTRQRERRRRRRHKVQVRNGSIPSMSKAKKDNSRPGKRFRDSWPNLPADIWCNIHSLMPMQDSARAACVSRAFLHSWKRHPNLILTKETLGLKQNACGKGDIARAFTSKVDQILKNHSGTGVKTLELDIFDCRDLDTCYLNNWLQIAITPGIENITLWLPLKYRESYTFPCSLLFGGNGSSIRHLHLTYCAFRPTIGIGCLRSLTNLYLHDVHITGEQLGCLLSNSFALKKLELIFCDEIICLKIPCMLERLSWLTVSYCRMLQMIESKAPNLSTIYFDGDLVQLSLGQSLQVKNLDMRCSNNTNFLCYAITKLPYIVPNLETLTLSSISERINTPVVAAKFLHLKYLEFFLDGDLSPGYDYLSLVSFLDASPVLETFILGVNQGYMEFDSIFGDASHMRQMSEHKHDSLKDVTIFGFCSAKSMVELTCHILENATSLECITLDSVFDANDKDDMGRCSVTSARKTGECSRLTNQMIMEANRGLMAIERYIVGKVPSTVKLDVRGPCSWCHTLEL
ncbi:uncharacterized protein LOC133922425 [Phragmites australis]|uniref:uncharacterized protein LOC133922425 n=1 Tax=Phragmites australis TaxID=29695 RepID=UPI002D79E1EC|nr:uncharacterized protein LOC133922425 [Phragmites australis]